LTDSGPSSQREAAETIENVSRKLSQMHFLFFLSFLRMSRYQRQCRFFGPQSALLAFSTPLIAFFWLSIMRCQCWLQSRGTCKTPPSRTNGPGSTWPGEAVPGRPLSKQCPPGGDQRGTSRPTNVWAVGHCRTSGMIGNETTGQATLRGSGICVSCTRPVQPKLLVSSIAHRTAAGLPVHDTRTKHIV